MMLKYFRVLFGQGGTRTTVPDTAPPDGSVSYTEGYGVDYQRPKTDALSKNIERDKFNQLLFDMTGAIQEQQSQGIPDYITAALNGGSAFSYSKGAMVRWTDGNAYISLVNANTSDPTDVSKWVVFSADKLAQILNLVSPFGGVGNGSTNDQAALDLATSMQHTAVTVNDGKKFLVTAINNAAGVLLGSPFGHIVKSITGGQQKLNSPGDINKYVFGAEYLAAFHNLIVAQSTAPTRKLVMTFTGDSTTFGDSVAVDYTPSELMKRFAEARGLQTSYGLTSNNRGQPGKAAFQWVSTYLAGDLATNPDVLVVRWLINDPGWLQDGSAAPADAGQNYPNRRTPADGIAAMRAGLAQIRASRPVSNLSIVLLPMNATGDTPNARDELWQEQVLPGLRQAARDYQCTFIDIFSYLRDCRPAAGIWMDNPFSDGRPIHPLGVMNLWITQIVGDVLFPTGLQAKLSRTNCYSIAGVESPGDVTALPSTYRKGETRSRAFNTAGFPLDGSVITIRTDDDTVKQEVFPYLDAQRGQSYVRYGRAATLTGEAPGWSAWYRTGTRAADVTAAAGFTLPGTGQLHVTQVGQGNIIEGYLNKSAAATIPAGTLLATIPAGSLRPTHEALYGAFASVYDGANFEARMCRISPDGTITLLQASTLVATRVYISGISWASP